MSNPKQKNKQKKSQSEVKLEKKCTQMHSQIMETSYIVKSLQEKNSTLAIQNNQLIIQNEQLTSAMKQESQKYNLNLESFRLRINDLSCNKNELEIQIATYKAKLDYEHFEYEQYKKEKEKEIEDNKKHYQIQLGRLEAQYIEYQLAITQKNILLAERNHLNGQIKEQREIYKQNVADKQRQKLQALDNIKRQSKERIIQMKNNLLSVRKDQLSNNTRLILLQNNQLIEELDYQSFNTEKVIYKNKELEKKVHQLQTQLQIQRELQVQITKRSVMCKNMLKEYMSKNKQKQNGQKTKQTEDFNLEGMKGWKDKEKQLLKIIQLQTKKLKQVEKELNKTKLQNTDIRNELTHIKSQGNNLLFLIYREYMQLLDGKYQQCQNFDIEAIKKTHILKWKKQDLSIIIRTLVSHLAKHIQKEHLDHQLWRKIVDRQLGTKSEHQEQIIYKNKDLNTNYIKEFELKRHKGMAEKRKLSVSLQGHRQLNRVSSEKWIPVTKYLQCKVREWGNQVQQKNRNLVNRFMKPIKYKLK